MANKKFIVTTIYQEKGLRATSAVIGVFANEEKAVAALQNAFHRTCDVMGVKELNAYSYYDEGDCFHVCDGKKETWHYDGEMHEVEEDLEYIDWNIGEEEDEEEVSTSENLSVVPSLADLIAKIERNIDNGDGSVEVVIRLNFGTFSRKKITFDEGGCGDDGRYRFEVFNFIDDTTEKFTIEDLFDVQKTLIGKAISMGQLYYVLD